MRPNNSSATIATLLWPGGVVVRALDWRLVFCIVAYLVCIYVCAAMFLCRYRIFGE